jgi:hypothetical protein
VVPAARPRAAGLQGRAPGARGRSRENISEQRLLGDARQDLEDILAVNVFEKMERGDVHLPDREIFSALGEICA